MGPALALSLILHAALLAVGPLLIRSLPPATTRPEPSLNVRLVEPAPQPELHRREDTPPAAVTRAPKIAPPQVRPREPVRRAPVIALARKEASALAPAGAQVLKGEAARKAGEQIARELFYPPEAIERGLEGEALVLLFLDEGGNAVAARIEASSGHALLDQAAVRAARTLRSLPGSAPREALLPVRFRLR